MASLRLPEPCSWSMSRKSKPACARTSALSDEPDSTKHPSARSPFRSFLLRQLSPDTAESSPVVVEMSGIVDEDARSQPVLGTPTYEPGEERASIQAAIGNVRPIGAPEHSVGCRLDEGWRNFRRVVPIGTVGKADWTGQRDPHLPRFHRLDKIFEISIGQSVTAFHVAHMIHRDRNANLGKMWSEVAYHHARRIKLDMPSKRMHKAGRSAQCLQILRLDSPAIVHPEEVDPQTPNAPLVKFLEHARSDLCVGKNDDTPRSRAGFPECLQYKAVIRAIKARLDKHHSFDRKYRRHRRVLLQAGAGIVVTWNCNARVAVRRSEGMHSELARDARVAERHNRLHPDQPAQTSHLDNCLNRDLPIIAATDYVRAYPELIAAHVGRRYLALGTDGFGRSDTREALREFFEVDRRHIAIAAITELLREGRLAP